MPGVSHLSMSLYALVRGRVSQLSMSLYASVRGSRPFVKDLEALVKWMSDF